MSKFLEKESSDTLYRAIVSLQDVDECRRFFQDLCTVSELKAMEQRDGGSHAAGPGADIQ